MVSRGVRREGRKMPGPPRAVRGRSRGTEGPIEDKDPALS